MLRQIWRVSNAARGLSKSSAQGARADAAAAAGRLDTARELYRAAIAQANAVRTDALEGSLPHLGINLSRAVHVATLYGGLADVERAAGNVDLALAHLHTGEAAIRGVLPGSVYEAMAVNRIGVAYFEAGAIEEALAAHHTALHMLDHPAPVPTTELTFPQPIAFRSVVLSSLGAVYAAAGDLERAQRLTAEALDELPVEGTDSRTEAGCLSNAGLVLRAAGQLHAAVEYFERALRIQRKSFNRHDRLAALNNLGDACIELGDLPRAREALEEAHRILRSAGGVGAAAATILNNMAVLNLRSGRAGDARSLLHEAVAACRGVAAPLPELARTYANLAVYHLDAGRTDDAVSIASEGVDIVETIRRRMRTPTGREQLSEQLQAPYQALIAALYATDDAHAHARAFTIAEMSRARGLTDTFELARRTAEAREPAPAEEVRLRRRHATAYRTLNRALDSHATREELYRLSSAERKLSWQVESAVRGRLPADGSAPAVITTVQNELGQDTLLLSYEINARGAFVWSVRRQDFVMLRLADDGLEVMRLLRTATENYHQALPTTQEQRDALHRLGALLLGSLPAHHLRDAKRIVVVSGMLANLPLEPLPLSPDHLLGDVRSVSYLPSAATLLELRSRSRADRPTPTRDFLGVAPTYRVQSTGPKSPPLPAGRRAMRVAAERFTSSVILEGPQATEAAVLGALGPFRYLHFASHGHMDAEQPLQSGLLLEPPTAEESALDEDASDLLHLHSLLDLTMSADVVVCAGCQTGLGRLREGEGMIGFGTVFLAAGARCLVLSLWPVRDLPTARLMEAFYAEIQHSTPPVAALSRAKQRVRKSHPEVYEDPVTWAGFIAIGAPDEPAS